MFADLKYYNKNQCKSAYEVSVISVLKRDIIKVGKFMKMKIKKGDTVKIRSGKDAGKTGKVTFVIPKEGKIVVEKINILTRHTKPRKQGDAGGILKNEGSFDASKAQLVCPKCGEVTRVGRRKLTDGTNVRYCKKCDEEI